MLINKLLISSLILSSIGLTWLYNPQQAHSATNCGNITINISPIKTTYLPNETLTITVSGYDATQNPTLQLFSTHTSNNTQDGNIWELVSSTNTNQTTWTTTWTPGTSLPFPPPYHQSEYQERFLALNIIENGQLICTGNPDPGPDFSHLTCPNSNCTKVVVTKPNRTEPTHNIQEFLNVQPGYSFSYQGTRHDNPRNDANQPVSGNNLSRMEYEAPVEICPGMPLVPQRFTKSNRWGYWGPAHPDPEVREERGIWGDGRGNLRFHITHPNYS